MVKDEIKTVLNLQDALQNASWASRTRSSAVAQRVRTARANLDDPNKPKGVFLFVGPSGIGKTETALALADLLYGGERKLITINMSEYQEAHSVSGLKGSPPGYVGYGEGGVLTEAVRRNPYSVVLLDEIEKAHADVMELFFQVFDKGVMDDAEGREIDFRNTIIILTSNVASAAMMQACLNKRGTAAGGGRAGTTDPPAA
jgi:type VI secretion system protein VasG